MTSLIEKFLEGEELTDDDEMKRGITPQLAAAKLDAGHLRVARKMACGIMNLINVIKNFAPSPAAGNEYRATMNQRPEKGSDGKADSKGPFSAVVWKTYIDQYAGQVQLPEGHIRGAHSRYRRSEPTETPKERISKLYHGGQQDRASCRSSLRAISAWW